MTTHFGPLTGSEARAHFDAQLAQIRQELVDLGALVVDNLRRGGEAMLEGRLDLIPEIRSVDREIDDRFVHLEREIFETIARQQPVAGDLRLLVAATRIIYEQERSGELVLNCLNMLEREGGFPEVPEAMSVLSRAIDAAARVFQMSVDAIAEMDPEGGVKLEAADDEVDLLVSEFYAEIGRNANDVGLDTAIALSRVGRFLERIADHGVNIAENVTYVATARLPRASHPTLSDQP